MKKQLNPQVEKITEDQDLWQGRYLVRAEITYRDHKGKAATLQVIHFQPEMSADEVFALLQPLGFVKGTEEYRYLASQAKDTFSAGQAEALVDFLNRRRGTYAYIKPAQKPRPALMGASALPFLPSFRDRSIYKVHLEPGYDLPIKVEAVNMKIFISMAHLIKEFREIPSATNHQNQPY